MEPAGTTTTTTAAVTTTATTAGVLAAQDAIVFSGTGAEGVTPPAAAPATAPAGTDVFWASLVRAQLCVQELQGAIEGRPDGDHRDRTSRDVWHHGHGAAAAAAPSVSQRRRGPGSTGESVSHQHVPADGSVSPEFVPAGGSSSRERRGLGSTYENFFRAPTGGSISPKSTPVDESIFRQHRGHGSTHESIFRVPTDGTVSPKSVPVGGSIFHEHQGCGIAYESVSHVSVGGSVSNEHRGRVPTDGNISPRSMSVDGSISPVSMPTDETGLQEHVPIDGTNSSKSTPVDETNSTKSVPTDGSISHQGVPKDGTISPKSVPTDGSISHQHVPKDGTISPKSVSMDGSISPKSVPTDGSISQEHVPMDGTISPKSMPMDGSISLEHVPMGGRVSPKALTAGWSTSPKSLPADGSISPAHVPVDGSISPEFTPTGGTTSPKRWNPQCSEEEEEEDDEDDDGCSSREEDAEEEEDLEEEEPHFHTNPLFQSRVPAPAGARRVPLYRPHGAALRPLLVTEGDDGTGGTGEGRGCPPPTSTPPPLGCRPAGGDVGSTTEGGPPRPPGLMLSDPPDLPPGSGGVPRSLRLQPEWGYWDPPGPLAPLELTLRGGDQDPPSPGYPPGVAPGGGDQDLPLPRPLTPPKPPLGGGYRTPPPPPDLPQGGGYQKPPPPPYQPIGGGYQPPPSPPSPLDFPQPPPSPPYQPIGGAYEPPPSPPPSPPNPLDFPQPPPSPPYQPMGGGYQPPPSPPNPLDFPQPPLSPPYQPMGGGYEPPPSPPSPLDFPQPPPSPPYQPIAGGYDPPPSPPNPLNFLKPPPSPPYQPMGGGYQPPPSLQPPLDHPQPPPTPLYWPMGGGYQPPPNPLPPPDHPQPPSPLSSLPPRGPPGPGVIRGAWGGPPVPGHGCAWLLASPDASCPGGEVVQGPPLPATPSLHPTMEELPPETGEEPPPDPPASTHGCPPGGSAVTPALANGGQGRRGEAQRLAARLFHLDGFKKSQVAAFLRKNNDFSGMVAQEYLDFFQFGGQTLDQALRSFLQALVLTGETQERERILGHFSRRYHHCNPGAFPSPDAVHSLTCAIMLLNTDLHGQRLGRAMTSAEFVANLSGMMDGQDFPREQLKALYGSIRSEKLAWADDEEEEEEEETAGGGSLAPPGCKKSNPFLDLPGGTGAVTYRRGWLARKVLAEADGKKTPWGRRGWKPFQAVLKGTVLYFLKPGGRTGVPRRPPEPGPFPAPQEEEGPEAEEPLGVHHALAERASKYTKRPNVFRLQTADWRVFLFQAPTSEEMFSWISRINLVAALFSSPPFPAAVGSQRRFVRPILPAAPSRVPPEEQHRSHEAWMERVAQELFEHQRNLPEKRGRARDLDEYRLKKEYLLYERRRYETYVQVLETWISAGAQDLEGWEAQAGPVVAPPDPPTLTKAHSSPSLVPEPPIAPTVRVKRNISERRTVRKIVPKRNKNLL